MKTPPVIAWQDLDDRLIDQPGWLALHVGIPLHSRHGQSASAFDRARLPESSAPVTLVRCELSPREASRCTIATGVTSVVHLYKDGEYVESIAALEDPEGYAEWLTFALSFHSS